MMFNRIINNNEFYNLYIDTSAKKYNKIIEFITGGKMTKKQDLQAKYDNLQAKYKTLAGRHRQYLMQKTNEKKRLEQLKTANNKIILELSNKIYELSTDDDLTKNDDFIKKTIKEQKHD